LFYQKIIYASCSFLKLSNGPGAGKYSYTCILLHNFPNLCLFPSSGTIMVPSLVHFVKLQEGWHLNKPNGLKFANGFSFALQSDEGSTVRFETLRILIKKREQKCVACSYAIVCKVFGLQRHLNDLLLPYGQPMYRLSAQRM
jgi:hypothetical protein